jgi:putative ABC transport system permease protein
VDLGSRVEIMEHEVKIVGMTRGIRSMSTAPFVFTSYETARKLASYIGDENTVFVLVKAEPGVPAAELKARLQARLPFVDVLTKAEYSRRTRRYWTIQTGMGFGFLMVTLLAIVVGITIVGQTVYAATMEHIREYATLRALGATDGELRSILWLQGAVSAVLGYLLGVVIFLEAARGLDALGLSIVVPFSFYPSILALDVAMCLSASLVSVRKALSLDPAMVFKA